AAREDHVRDLLRTRDLYRARREIGVTVGAEDDLRVEHLEQTLEVAVARRGEERIDDLALLGEALGARLRLDSPHAPSGAARKLARCRGGAPGDRGDLSRGQPRQCRDA